MIGKDKIIYYVFMWLLKKGTPQYYKRNLKKVYLMFLQGVYISLISAGLTQMLYLFWEDHFY